MFGRALAAYVTIFGALALVLSACGDPPRRPSPLTAIAPSAAATYSLQNTVEVSPSGGDSRTLRAGSHWMEVGMIAEGTVYKPRGTVLTVERTSVSEAYIVVRDGVLAGFWLPMERAFVPAEKAIAMPLQRED